MTVALVSAAIVGIFLLICIGILLLGVLDILHDLRQDVEQMRVDLAETRKSLQQ